MRDDTTIPPMALALGIGGLIPFVVCAAAVALGLSLPLVDDPERALLAYGAVILSFLGGIRWGFALRMSDDSLQGRAFLLSVGPSIAAWLTLLAPVLLGLLALPVMFLMLGIADRQLVGVGAPPWFAKLRTVLTAVVVLALLGAVAGLAV